MLLKTIAFDERLVQLSLESEYLYLKAIPHQDDYGRMPGSPAFMRGTAIPARAERERWTDEKVQALMEEWRCTVDDIGQLHPLARIERVNGVLVCELAGFEKTQKLRRRSKSTLPRIPDTAPAVAAGQESLFSRTPSPSGGELQVRSPLSGGGREDGIPANSEDLDLRREENGTEENYRLTSSASSVKALDQVDDNHVRTAYDCWRTERGKTHRRYATMSKSRRTKIVARLRDGFTVEELCTAISAVALDPWRERKRHDDLAVIFRSREQVERFLEIAEQHTRSNGRDLKAYDRA